MITEKTVNVHNVEVNKIGMSDRKENYGNVRNMKVNKIKISGRKENYRRKILYKNW